MALGYVWHVWISWFVWYVVSGELTKLRAYGFQFWFQVLPIARGRARDDCCAHTMILAWDVFTLICLTNDYVLRNNDLWFLCDVLIDMVL